MAVRGTSSGPELRAAPRLCRGSRRRHGGSSPGFGGSLQVVAGRLRTSAVRAGVAVPRRHRVLRAGGDRGYSVLEAAITLPVIFLLLMSVVQWAIVWHSRTVAEAAAQEALRGAQSYQSTAAAGQAEGNNYLAQVAPHALGGNCVTVTRTATTVTVRVHCQVMSVIPFGTYYATETVSGPVERFVSVP